MKNQTVGTSCANGLGKIVAVTEFAIVVRTDSENKSHGAPSYATWSLNENGETMNGHYSLSYDNALLDMVKRSS